LFLADVHDAHEAVDEVHRDGAVFLELVCVVPALKCCFNPVYH
jgi:hypothetical protein